MSDPPARTARAKRPRSGAGEPLLVLLSGGGDSVCLLDVAVRLGAQVSALHVNYGLRPDGRRRRGVLPAALRAAGGAARVERVRAARRRATSRPRRATRATRWRRPATDRATTRRRTPPPTRRRRCSTGWPCRPAAGRCWGMERPARPAGAAAARGDARGGARVPAASATSSWREDPSNDDPRFARARVRHEVVPALKHARARRPSARSPRPRGSCARRPRCSTCGRRTRSRRWAAAPRSRWRRSRELPAALRRLVLRRLAESAAGGRAPALAQRRRTRCWPSGARGTKSLDLGGGLRAVAEYGTLRFVPAREDAGPPEPVELLVPGSVRVRRLGGRGPARRRRARCPCRRAAVGGRWCAPGARATAMRPVGLGGTKTLQDLFTDRKVPRALRRRCPWSRLAARSCGWPAWRSTSASPARGRGRSPWASARARSDEAAAPGRLRLAADGRPRHRRDPRAARRARAPRARARRGDLARLRGPRPAAGGRAQGRGLLPLRPHAPPRARVRGGLHGRRLVRLLHRLVAGWCGSSRTSTRRSRAATC